MARKAIAGKAGDQLTVRAAVTRSKAVPKSAEKSLAAKALKPGAAALGKNSATPTGKAPKNYRPIAPERVDELLQRLRKRYPAVRCALHHESAWQLLVATILSAQCTDARVNLVTPVLFRIYPQVSDLAKASPAAVEEVIRTTGFFRNKTKSILGAANMLLETFGGEVPRTMDELLLIPGVARKTANVVLGVWFGIGVGVVVDTHVFRVSRRLDLTTAETPEKIELALMKVVPQNRWIDFSHELIHHGRQLCIARKPKCAECPLENICHAPDKTWSTVWQHPAVVVTSKLSRPSLSGPRPSRRIVRNKRG